jgi:hypothetical protein
MLRFDLKIDGKSSVRFPKFETVLFLMTEPFFGFPHTLNYFLIPRYCNSNDIGLHQAGSIQCANNSSEQDLSRPCMVFMPAIQLRMKGEVLVNKSMTKP